MPTLTVTPAQARLVAQRVQAVQEADALLRVVLEAVTAGHDVAGTLTDINVDTGVLTFTVHEPPMEQADGV